MQFVLLIRNATAPRNASWDQWRSFGPYESFNAAEHAAMGYYRTGITGASIKGEFMIVEHRAPSMLPAGEG